MKTLIKLIFTGIFISTFGFHSYGQGCSDAGICTTGIMAEAGSDSVNSAKFNINLGYHLAQGDDGTQINTLLLEASYSFSSSTYFQVKVPYHMINGNLGENNGIGDITISFNALVKKIKNHYFEAFLGLRIGTGQANQFEGGNPLPMVYQTSLGTTDLLLGGKWTYRGWGASLAYQQPLTQNNENGFLKSLWEGNPDAVHYADSRNIERKGDLAMRVEKTFSPGNFDFTAGLVPIYHLGEDSYVDEDHNRKSIEGSDGLTLNVSLSARYHVGTALTFGAFYGSPLITRDVQPAGLARKYVAGLSAGFRF